MRISLKINEHAFGVESIKIKPIYSVDLVGEARAHSIHSGSTFWGVRNVWQYKTIEDKNG